jgi:hypothetical protein
MVFLCVSQQGGFKTPLKNIWKKKHVKQIKEKGHFLAIVFSKKVVSQFFSS